MLLRTRAVIDNFVRPLLPFPFRNDAMRANVGSRSGWNAAATTVISEFLLVRSLLRHSHFMYHVCARTRSSSSSSSACPFARFIRGAVRTTRSLVHHSWVSLRDGSINPTIILRAEVDEEIISNSHARNRTHLPRLDCGVFIIIGYTGTVKFIVALYRADNRTSISGIYYHTWLIKA